MSSDPRLKAAVAHWGPRFVANGVVLTDFEEVTSSIASYDEWCGAWSKRAAHHEQLGREALAKKRLLTAGDGIFIAPGIVHASFNVGDSDAQVIAIFGPCVGDAFEAVDVSKDEPWRGLRT